MATVTVTDDVVRIELTRFEKIAGILRDQEIPVGSITAVAFEPDPIRAVRGIRAPGMALPRRTMIGTWRGRGRRRFVRVRRGEPGVRIEAEGQRYDTYLVGTPGADALATELERRLDSGAADDQE